MIVQRKLLLSTTIAECGHLFQAWTEVHEDGSWEAHFHAECGLCESVATHVRDTLFPGTPITRGD